MSETVSAKSVSSRVKHSAKWWGRVPASVSLDPAISSDAVRVYAMIALSVYQTSTASIGMREMGRVLRKSAATVKRRIDELIAAGHVERAPIRTGQRAWYILTSPAFGQKQRAGAREVVVCPRGNKRLVSIPREEIA